MNKERFAGLDIGSNTVLMLIAEKEGKNLKIIRDEHSIARLGENVWKTNEINNIAIERAKAVLEKYKKHLQRRTGYANICKCNICYT
jgi:exopolyphosphatase/guanosine-5'-triphosphate,3'-diphosphate pyrophosphatase